MNPDKTELKSRIWYHVCHQPGMGMKELARMVVCHDQLLRDTLRTMPEVVAVKDGIYRRIYPWWFVSLNLTANAAGSAPAILPTTTTTKKSPSPNNRKFPTDGLLFQSPKRIIQPATAQEYKSLLPDQGERTVTIEDNPGFKNALFITAHICNWRVRRRITGTWIFSEGLAFRVNETRITVISGDPSVLPGYLILLERAYPTVPAVLTVTATLKNILSAPTLYDEWTTVITDPATCAAVAGAIGSCLTIPSPDDETPGLRIYECAGAVRIETLAAEPRQRAAGFSFHETLHRLLPTIAKDPAGMKTLLSLFFKTKIGMPVPVADSKAITIDITPVSGAKTGSSVKMRGGHGHE